ncbi:cAMP-specific 3',5'-cyclic phosphodiesterase 4D [Phlyctochytrium planicorne]|nr:cAMP-specific 3',5'-cyclic phosphodiesterase 4D [Phlyctochytrium planicorne]
MKTRDWLQLRERLGQEDDKPGSPSTQLLLAATGGGLGQSGSEESVWRALQMGSGSPCRDGSQQTPLTESPHIDMATNFTTTSQQHFTVRPNEPPSPSDTNSVTSFARIPWLSARETRWKFRKRHPLQNMIFISTHSCLFFIILLVTIHPITASPKFFRPHPIRLLPDAVDENSTPTSTEPSPDLKTLPGSFPPNDERTKLLASLLNRRQDQPPSPAAESPRPTAALSALPPPPLTTGLPTVRIFFPVPKKDPAVTKALANYMIFSAQQLQQRGPGGGPGLLAGANVEMVEVINSTGSDALIQPFMAINNGYSVGVLGDGESASQGILFVANAFKIPLCDIGDNDDKLLASYPWRFQVTTKSAHAIETMMLFLKQKGFNQVGVILRNDFTDLGVVNDAAKNSNVTIFGPYNILKSEDPQPADCSIALQTIKKFGTSAVVFMGELADMKACLEMASSMKMLYDDGYTWVVNGLDTDLVMNKKFETGVVASGLKGMFLMGEAMREGDGYQHLVSELDVGISRFPDMAPISDPIPSIFLLYRTCLEVLLNGYDRTTKLNGPNNTISSILELSKGIYGSTINQISVPKSFDYPGLGTASGNFSFQEGGNYRKRNFTLYYGNGSSFTLVGMMSANNSLVTDDAMLKSLGWKNPNDVPPAYTTGSNNRSLTIAIGAGVSGIVVAFLIGVAIWVLERYYKGEIVFKPRRQTEAKTELKQQNGSQGDMDGPGTKAINILRSLRDPNAMKNLKPSDVDYLIDVFTSGNAYVPNLDDFSNVGGTEIDEEMRAWVLGSVLASNAGPAFNHSPMGLMGPPVSSPSGRYISQGALPVQPGSTVFGAVSHAPVVRMNTVNSEMTDGSVERQNSTNPAVANASRNSNGAANESSASVPMGTSYVGDLSGVGTGRRGSILDNGAPGFSGARRNSSTKKTRRLSVASNKLSASGSLKLSGSALGGASGLPINGTGSTTSHEGGLQKQFSVGGSSELERVQSRGEAVGKGYKYNPAPYLIVPSPVDAVDSRAIFDYLDLWYLNWNLDMFEVCELTMGHPLYFTGLWLYDQDEIIKEFKIPRDKFMGWLLGYNNQFLVKSRHPMALMYSDTSVNEFHHSAHVFQLSTASNFNIFSDLANEEYEEARRIVIRLIFATDMGKHFEYLTKFKTKISTNGFNRLEQQESRMTVMEIAMKCADLNNPSKTPDLAGRWCESIMEEFYRQGDCEREIGLPVSQFMDRNNTNVAKCQIGFIDILVAPLFDAWTHFNHGDERCSKLQKAIQRNRSRWAGLTISQQLAQNLLGQINQSGPSSIVQYNVNNTVQSTNVSATQIAQNVSNQKKASNTSVNTSEDENASSSKHSLFLNPPALPPKVGYLETMPSISGSAIGIGNENENASEFIMDSG